MSIGTLLGLSSGERVDDALSAAAEAACLSRPRLYDRLRRVERVRGVEVAGSKSQLSLYVAALALEGFGRPGTPRLGEEIVN